jgi:hypothetical protein
VAEGVVGAEGVVVVVDNIGEDDQNSCNKYVLYHNGLTPGIFAIFCPHGICVGFKIMSTCEGPGTAFQFIFHRFKWAPKLIVYENACNLHKYCV